MNKKQIIGIVVAGIVFVFVCMMSVFTNRFSDAVFGEKTDMVKELFSSNELLLPEENFVGIVNVQGTIQDAGAASWANPVPYDHQATLAYISQMMNSEYNKGILLYVNSPGGTVYHSDELYLKLMEYKEATGRPVWSYIASQGCSGAYYASCAADRIGANRNGWVGSIGVIISYYNYSELFEKLGVEEINITSGKNKAMGSSAKDLTAEQEEIMQGLVDESYEQFVDIVAKGRDLSREQVRKLADGRLYSASQALSNGLLDDVASYQQFQNQFCLEFGGNIYMYEPDFMPESLLGSLFAKIWEREPKSEAEQLQDLLDQKGSGVPLYYAELHK